jgi:deoxyribodipyrimidine photo-lyase
MTLSTPSVSTAVMWFRRDLRLDDNPAWAQATRSHDQAVAVFVLDRRLVDRAGKFRRRQLFANLAALDDELRTRRDASLCVRWGDPAAVLPGLIGEVGATGLYFNADVSPYATARDQQVLAAVGDIAVHISHGTLVHPPNSVLTRAGGVSKVFTPFWRTWAATPLAPWPKPGDATVVSVGGDPLPVPDAPPPMDAGSAAALRRLERFAGRADGYGTERDLPAIKGTSELSADLKFGTVSPRTVLDVVGQGSAGRDAWCRQLAWRDWYAHLLLAHPRLVTEPMADKFRHVAWIDDPAGFAAWCAGRTGYPLVDAGMRQLATTGWMHNRVRMVTASFLVKDLLIDWRQGERHFRHLLVDADTPQNVGNWQWSAGTGPDAAPYHRIMNPVTQSQRFDADGDYIRRWVPELAGLPAPHVHAPWEAPPLEVAAAGITLGDSYPWPIVNHSDARQRFMSAFKPPTPA